LRTRSVEPVGELVRVGAQVVVRAGRSTRETGPRRRSPRRAADPAGPGGGRSTRRPGVRGGRSTPCTAPSCRCTSPYCSVLPMYVAQLWIGCLSSTCAVSRSSVLAVPSPPSQSTVSGLARSVPLGRSSVRTTRMVGRPERWPPGAAGAVAAGARPTAAIPAPTTTRRRVDPRPRPCSCPRGGPVLPSNGKGRRADGVDRTTGARRVSAAEWRRSRGKRGGYPADLCGCLRGAESGERSLTANRPWGTIRGSRALSRHSST
jgi:hypothetical protein